MEKMEKWVRENARPLEVAKWDYVFHGGSKEKIVAELVKFQNADGGFGNALEADIWLPDSNAITSAEAIFTVYEYDLDCGGEWFSRLLGWFENTASDIPCFWDSVPPEVENFPRAPWWGYDRNDELSPNPCATIASALVLHGNASQKALGEKVAQKCYEFILSDKDSDDHECFCLQHVVEKLQPPAEIIAATKRRIVDVVCLDENKWGEYVAQPLDLAYSPRSMWHECVADGVEKNIACWLRTLNESGVWRPHFDWGCDSDTGKQATKNWTGFMAVRRAKILQNYGVPGFAK